MPSADLPPDLAALEQELADRPRAEAPPALRGRVLAAVGRELAPARRPRWQFAAALVTAALLWANFSMSVANNMTWPLADDPDTPPVEETATRIRALAPELGEGEARRQAL